MGYHTWFSGKFSLNRPLEPRHKEYLEQFSDTRRMKWDANQIQNVPDPIREAVGLPLGVEGEFFVADTGSDGQETSRPGLISSNEPPGDQPSLWCQWIPSEDGAFIVWNEAEKFYGYVEWLRYIIDKFLKTWGYVLDGEVHWEGQDELDDGAIIVKSNEIEVVKAISVIGAAGNARRLRVFLCHSSSDKPKIREIYKRLVEVGIDPWLDEENLLPGQDWEFEIRRAVKDTDVVVVCISQNSVTKIGFVQKEIKFALDIADEQPEGTVFIIPLRLDNCTVPERLKRWHWVDYESTTGFDRLVAAFKSRADFLSDVP